MSRLVSIITPAHNAQSFILETIASVQAQTYSNWEMIIVDDYSTDGTWDVLNRVSNSDSRVKPFRLSSNKGAGYARNYAMKKAIGSLIAFLDSDDLWDAQKLEKQVDIVENNSEAFVFSHYRIVSENGNAINQNINFPQRVRYSDLLKSCYIGCLTVMIDIRKTGPLRMPAITRSQDYALWLKILRKGFSAFCIPESLATYRIRTQSISRNKWIKARYQWIVYRKYEKFTRIKSLYYFLFYSIKGFLKNRKLL